MGWGGGGGGGGGPCDYCVSPVPIGLRFGFGTALGLGLGLRGPDLGLRLDKKYKKIDGRPVVLPAAKKVPPHIRFWYSGGVFGQV